MATAGSRTAAAMVTVGSTTAMAFISTAGTLVSLIDKKNVQENLCVS